MGQPSKGDLGLRFARIVARRRLQLNLTLDQLHAAGGPSDVTTGKIERAQIEQPSANTFKKLDAGLQWIAGSAARVFTGQDPVLCEEISNDQTRGHGTDAVTVPISVVNALSKIAFSYARIAEACPDTDSNAALRTVNSELSQVVDRISRRWLITQIEQRMSHRPPLPLEPMVEILLHNYLDAVSEPTTSEDSQELRYLESLSGRVG
ncbi:hypothetical protein [Rhodococcus sp. 27YEA6]|uniref:hypothetical protein n=1 Tax=Rhodococcus sp. 27YEA6 TaxID=3156273 RepID=UPI0038388DE2